MGKETLRFTSPNNHELCIIEEVTKLMKLGYTCYLEEELWVGTSKTKRGCRAVVDIYATKGKQEILVEVGTLSCVHGDRIILLRKLKPNAKVVHIQQWKNYGINESLLWLLHQDWKRSVAWDKYVSSGQYHKELMERLSSL